MRDTTGRLRVTVAIENPLRPGERAEVSTVVVDRDTLLTWVPREVLEGLAVAPRKRVSFLTADGNEIARDVGFVVVCAGGTEAVDEVVFAEPGDRTVLGAHSLSGLNLTVSADGSRLVDAGPVIAASQVRVA